MVGDPLGENPSPTTGTRKSQLSTRPRSITVGNVEQTLREAIERELDERLAWVERERHDELVEIEGRISQALAARFRDEIAALRAEVRRLSAPRRFDAERFHSRSG